MNMVQDVTFPQERAREREKREQEISKGWKNLCVSQFCLAMDGENCEAFQIKVILCYSVKAKHWNFLSRIIHLEATTYLHIAVCLIE